MVTNFKPDKFAVLNGLLVDLEYGSPDSSRFEELRTNICEKLTLRASNNCSFCINLESLHFSNSNLIKNRIESYDFLLLSPQGTPWRSYKSPLKQQLDTFRDILIKAILVMNIPVLGICGGHQFLALSFGGSIDFIDPAYIGLSPETYSQDILSERGLTMLETLADDRIFDGIVKHPATLNVVESHTEEVKNIPYPFVNLARSALSEIQLITIPGAIVYGMAFHPERGWNEEGQGIKSTGTAGERLLRNFFNLVYLNRS